MNTEQKQSLIKSLQGNKFFLKERQKTGLVIVTNNLNQEFWFDEKTFEEQIELHNLNKRFFSTHKYYHFIQREGEVVILKENPLEVKPSFKEYASNLVKTNKHKKYITFNETTLNEQITDNTVLFSKYEDGTISYLLIDNGEVYDFAEEFNGENTFFDFLYKAVVSESSDYITLAILYSTEEDKKEECTCDESCSNKEKEKCCKTITSENLSEENVPSDLRKFVLEMIGMDTLREGLKVMEDNTLIPIKLPDFNYGIKKIKSLYSKSLAKRKSFTQIDNNRITLDLDEFGFEAAFFNEKEPYIVYTLTNPNTDKVIRLKQIGFVEGQETTLMGFFVNELGDLANFSESKVEQVVKNIMRYSVINQLDFLPLTEEK